jgi:hypothetical protein
VYVDELTATIDIACFSAPFVVTLTKVFPTDGSAVRCDGTMGGVEPVTNVVIRWRGTVTESGGLLASENTNLCDGTDSIELDVAQQRTCTVDFCVGLFLDTDDCWKQFWTLVFTATDNYDGYLKAVYGSAHTEDFVTCPVPNLVINSCTPLDASADGVFPCLYGATAEEVCKGYTVVDQCVGSAWTAEVTE